MALVFKQFRYQKLFSRSQLSIVPHLHSVIGKREFQLDYKHNEFFHFLKSRPSCLASYFAKKSLLDDQVSQPFASKGPQKLPNFEGCFYQVANFKFLESVWDGNEVKSLNKLFQHCWALMQTKIKLSMFLFDFVYFRRILLTHEHIEL